MLNWFSGRPPWGVRTIILNFLFFSLFGAFPQEFFPDSVQENPPVELPVTLVLQGVQTGEVLARLPGADLHRLEILTQISSLLNQKNYNTILSLEREFVSLEFLRQLGLQVEFDEELLVLDVRIAAALMAPSVIPVRDRPAPIDPDAITSAPFSAYLNYLVSADFLYEDLGTDKRVSIPSRLNLIPVFQLHQWVLEGDFMFRTPPETAARVQMLRLVREFPGRGIRLAAGTVDPNWDGIIVGSSSSEGNRGGSAAPVLSEIIIEEPSVAEVYLNNRLIKRVRLSEGVHSLSDIPYSSGLNSLRVVVIRSDGSRKTYESRQPFDSNLLPQGDSTFSLAAGIPRFEWTSPLMTGAFSYGFSPIFTAGVNGQTDFNRFIGTFDAVLATPLGNWGAAFSVYRPPDAALLTSGALRYRLSFPGMRFAPVLGVGAEFFEPGFLSNLFQEIPSSSRYVLNFSYGQRLPLSAYLNLGATYRFNQWDEGGTGRVSATLLSSFNETASLSLSYGAEFTADALLEWQAAMTISINPAPAGKNLVVNQDLASGEASAVFSTPRWNILLKGFPPAVSDATSAEANLFLRPGPVNLFLGNSLTYEPSGELQNRFSAGASGALLFAGGYFAFTPPVADSFALVVPSEDMANQPLRIYGTGITEKENTGRVAALNELASYRQVDLVLDLPEADPDTVITQERVPLLPSYRSGTLVKPTLRQSVYGEGQLVDADGIPLALKAVEIVPQGGAGGEGEGSLTFSDEQGFFQFHNLFPGRYTLFLLSDPSVQEDFLLAAQGGNPVPLGIITLSSRENQK